MATAALSALLSLLVLQSCSASEDSQPASHDTGSSTRLDAAARLGVRPMWVDSQGQELPPIALKEPQHIDLDWALGLPEELHLDTLQQICSCECPQPHLPPLHAAHTPQAARRSQEQALGCVSVCPCS